MNNIAFRKYMCVILVLVFVLSLLPYDITMANTEGVFNLSITESAEVDGKKDITLNWDEYRFLGNANTKYTIARKNVNTNKWELRGRYEENIKVLNIYPNRKKSGQLNEWMNDLSDEYSNVHIEVDKVKISDFNENSEQYLYAKSNGLYNYDVIVFGFWDSNNGKDISLTASKAVQQFIDAGGGVLFGHDTVRSKGTYENFEDLVQNNMNIIATQKDYSRRVYSNLIEITKQGSVTTFPFDINGEEMLVPMSHTGGQLPTDDNDIYISFAKNYYPEEGDGPYFHYNAMDGTSKDEVTSIFEGEQYYINSYLMMTGNVGYIQCGHSSGETSLAEQKILANAIYALVTMHFETDAVDQIMDEQTPDKPDYVINGNEITFSSSDKGNEYIYRIIATPVGDDSPTLNDDLIAALETSNKYDDRTVFSNDVTVKIGGELEQFQYCINKKEIETSITDENYLALQNENDSTPYKYFEYDQPLSINNNEYMHIVAIDKALNVSEITTLNLMDILPTVTATVNFEDTIGNKIKDSITETLKYGVTFSPNVEIISDYVYKESVPSKSIQVYENNNVITHIYDEPVARDFYLVEHKTLETPEKIISHYYTTMFGMLNETVSLFVPTITNYTFLNYYTENSENDTNKIQVNGNKTEVVWENYPLYAHYEKDTALAKVIFTRSSDNLFLGEYSESGYINEVLNMKGYDIESASKIKDLGAYVNKIEVNKNRQMYINADESKNIMDIQLIPRTKEIIHYGIDFTQSTTSAAIELQETPDIVTYSNDVSPLVDLKYDGVDGWKVFDYYKGIELDFTNPTKTVSIGYYKGELPNESYEFKVDYINDKDKEMLESTYNSESIHVGQKVEIPFQNSIIKTNYGTTGRDVEFVASNIEIINDTTLQKKTFNIDEDYSTFFPELGYNGTYSIKVHYAPISKVNYIENVQYAKNINETNEYLLNVHWGDKLVEKLPYPKNKFEITELKVDGVQQPYPEDYVISLDITKYDHTVEVTYKEKTYNLTVNQISDAEHLSNVVKFEDVPLGEEIQFIVFGTNGYKYVGIDGQDADLANVDDDILTFYAKEEGEYVIDLHYKKESDLTTSYYFINGDKIVDDKKETWYIGDKYDILIPEVDPKEYEIAYAYVDGILYEGVESGDKYTVTITKPSHNLTLVYKQNPLYTLTVLSNEEEGYVNNPVDYFGGQEAHIEATANPEYEFVKWMFVKQNGAVIEDIYNPYTTLIMPAADVIVRANFEKIDDGNGGDGDKETITRPGGGNGGGSNKEDTETDSENDIDWEKSLHYKPYIVGYVDGTVKPREQSERIEFMKMIYNLVAIPNLQIDKSNLQNYSDVNSDAWYADALAFCVNVGIVTGFNDGTIKPNGNIHRSEVAVMLVKLMDYLEIEYVIPDEENIFKDANGHWSEYYINILYANNIAYGMPDGNFKPNDKITRAEIVAFINRLLNRDTTQFEQSVTFKDLPSTHWAYNDMMNAANGFNPYKYEIEHIN